MHEISYLNLRGIHENIEEELDQAYREVMDRQWFIGGEADRRFEQEFAAYCGAKACVGTGNGLDAIRLILLAYGIGEGDEVIVPHLHHLVAHAEFVIAIFFFRFSRLRWIQILLQNTVQRFHSQQSFPHRCEYLDIIWFCIDIFRKLLLDQCQQNTDDHIRILSF